MTNSRVVSLGLCTSNALSALRETESCALMQLVHVKDSLQAGLLERVAWVLLQELFFSSTLFQTAAGPREGCYNAHAVGSLLGEWDPRALCLGYVAG